VIVDDGVGCAALTIIYVTGRREPRFDWFADSLARQIDGDDLEVLVVDGHHGAARTAGLRAIVAGRFALRHVAPKPTPFSGPHRLTRRSYHTAASARNTGLVHTRADHVAFVDDCAVLGPEWLAEVRAAARGGYVGVGAYDKAWEMDVRDGVLISSRSDLEHNDGRWARGADDRVVAISGSELFGCSLVAPRALLLEVGGFDELCDSIGGEDWQLGVRLEWAGAMLGYSRRLLTVESEELHRLGTPAWRIDPVAEPAAYLERLNRFGVQARVFPDRLCDASNMLLDVLYGRRETASVGNYYDLARLTPGDLAATIEHFPRTHWFDGRALGDL
jgi:hypothetical protein